MTGFPVATPVTTPVPGTTVASDPLLLVHEPPPVPLANVVVAPIHTFAAPVIDAGFGFIVRLAVTIQPVGNV